MYADIIKFTSTVYVRLIVVTITVTIIIFPIIPVMIATHSKFITIYKNGLLPLITPYIINDSSSLFHVFVSLLKINIIIKRNFSTRHCIKSIIARKSFEFLLNFQRRNKGETKKKDYSAILVPWKIKTRCEKSLYPGYNFRLRSQKKKKEKKTIILEVTLAKDALKNFNECQSLKNGSRKHRRRSGNLI